MADIAETVFKTLITLFGSWLRWFITQPRLKIEGVTDSTRPDMRYASLVVTNVGRTVAKACQGSISFFDRDLQSWLMEISDAEPNEALPDGAKGEGGLGPNSFREIDRELLCWSKAHNPCEIDINPGTKVLLDVFKSINKPSTEEWYLVIPSEDGWRQIRCRLKDGDYSGKIIISPANGKPKQITFRVDRSTSQRNGPVLRLV